jgi:hypothetical protein
MYRDVRARAVLGLQLLDPIGVRRRLDLGVIRPAPERIDRRLGHNLARRDHLLDPSLNVRLGRGQRVQRGGVEIGNDCRFASVALCHSHEVARRALAHAELCLDPRQEGAVRQRGFDCEEIAADLDDVLPQGCSNTPDDHQYPPKEGEVGEKDHDLGRERQPL